MKTARVLLLGMATVLLLGLLPLAAARADTLVVGPDGYATIEEAVGAAQPGDTISVAAGTYTLASQVVLNKANVTLVGAGSSSTIVQVAGSVGQYPFNITANGVTLKGLQIVQTDKPTQDLIYVGGDNLTVEDNLIFGQYVLGDNNVSRAFVIAANASDVLIQNNTIRSLRQPAYISSRLGGTIKGNHVSGTRGWVVEGGDGFTFEGNTWGAGAEANIVDIAILSMAGPSLYPDILALSTANNGAVVEDQRVSPAVLTEVYVDAGAAEGGYGTSISPYRSIAPVIPRVVAGGKVHVAAGTYTENVTIDKMVTLLGAQAGVDARTRSGVAESLVQGRATVSAAASGTVIDGFTFQGPVSGTGMSAAGATIVNNIFDGFRYGLSLVPSSSGTVVQFNLFQTESWQGGQWMATNGIYSQSAGLSDVLVDSNKFTGHKGAAAIFSAQSAGGSMASITVSNNELVDDAPIKLMYVQDAEITNNTISGTAESDLKYGAIAIRGGVHNAQVTGNTIRTSQPSAIQIMDRNNETGPNSNLTISGNKMEGNAKGLDLVAGGYEGTLVAQNNWWGAASGPSGVGPGTGDSVSAGVTYSPWWANPAGTATASVGDDGSILVPENTPATDVQAILDSAPDDSTIVLAGDSCEGGLVINHPLTIIGADGTVIGPGSPAFTIASDGVTLDSLIIDGTRADDGTSGVVVNAGVSQLWIRRCEVRNWPADGIHFAGAITDLKLVDNYVHDNGLAGVSFAQAPAGIVQVYGNSFRNNGAEGIALAGPPPSLVARYNEWGDVEGPGGPNGDRAGAGVDYTPWVFGKLWVEADDNVRELDTTTVHVKVDTHQLFGASFALTFPTDKLQLVSAPAIGAFKAGTGAQFSASPVAEANATGVITVTAARGQGVDGYDAMDAVFLTLEFEAQEIESTSVEAEIGFANDTADLAAKDGINIRLDSVADDTITIWGTTTVKGVVHLQGRDNHAGAAVTFPEGLLWPALTRHTDSWGRYTFDHVSDGDYDVTFVMARYLDALVKAKVSGDQLTLGTVLLLGGDTDDNDKIDLADIGCIGHNYGRTTDVDERADINGDGRVNILDLVLAAGNYGLTGYSWAG